MKKIIFFLILLSIISAQSLFSGDNLREYFSEEYNASRFPFKIVKAVEKIKFFGFGKSKLHMKSYKIREIDHNIYELFIKFKSKKMLGFQNSEKIIFFYNGDIISFKTRKGKRTYKINNEQKIILRKTKNGYYIIKKIPLILTFKIEATKGKLYLTLEFY